MKKIFFIIILFSSISNAQPDTNINNSKSVGTFSQIWNDVKSSTNNGISFFKRPYYFDGNDWLLTGGVAISTGLLFLVDESVRTNIQNNLTNAQNKIVVAGDYYGQGIIPFGVGVGLYFSGLAFNNKSIRETGSTLVQALIASGITVTVLKVIFGRERPYSNQGSNSFKFFQVKNVFNSFPSGHAIIAFTTSTVISEKIDNIYATIGLYGLASLTVYQRLYSDNHWLSDAFLGSVLGVVIGKYFVKINKSYSDENESKISYNVFPVFYKHSSGLGISISF